MIEALLLIVLFAAIVASSLVHWWRLDRAPVTRQRIALVAVAWLALLLPAVWLLSRSRTVQLFGTIVSRVETTRPRVALTFDDGPTPQYTAEVLSVLQAEGVHATFFVTGAELAQHPELGRQIAEAGHELGNHSYSHERMLFLSPAHLRDELERTDALIRQTGFTGPIRFRAPYGKKLFLLPWYLSQTGRTHVTWDLEPDSETVPSADRIVKQVLEGARPGSIVLLHLMYPSREESRKALPQLIRGLKAKGFQLVTVSQLLASAGG